MNYILVVGHNELLVRLYAEALTRSSDDNTKVLRTLSCEPGSEFALGYPIHNTILGNEFGPLSSRFFLPSNTRIVYVLNVNEYNKTDLHSLSERCLAMWGTQKDSHEYIKINGFVKKLKFDKTERFHTSTLRKLKNEFTAEYRNTFTNAKAKFFLDSYFEHLRGWKAYCEVRNYCFDIIDFNSDISDTSSSVPPKLLKHCKDRFNKAILNSQSTEEVPVIKTDSKEKIARFVNEFFNDKKRKNTDFQKGKEDLNDKQKNTPLCVDYNFDSKGSTFTIGYSGMGFGDFYIRLERIYSFVKTFTDMSFVVPYYKNPHSVDVDFNELVSISGDTDVFNEANTVRIELAEFSFRLFTDSSFPAEDMHYEIFVADSRKICKELFNNIELNNEFISKLKINIPYQERRYFSTNQATLKVIYHMRRHDTAVKPLIPYLDASIISKVGQARDLLDFDFADQILKQCIESNSLTYDKIEIVVISDGFDDLQTGINKLEEKFFPQGREALNRAILMMDQEIKTGTSSLNNASVVERIIGRDKVATLQSVNAITNSDLVITSSGFSIMIAKIARVNFINAFTAMPALRYPERGVKISEICKFSG